MKHPALFVDVITTKRDDPDAVHDNRRVNFNNSRTRAWLANHMTWAFKTGHAVHVAAVPAADVRIRDLVQTQIALTPIGKDGW